MAFDYSFPEKVAHPAQRIHCLCGSAMQLKNVSPFLLVRLGKTPKLGFRKKSLPYIILIKYKLKGHPYLNYKLARNGFSAVVACCLQARNLSFASPPCLHSDWFASSFAQALGSPLVVLHFVILRFSLRFSDSRDPTLISDFHGCSRFWAAHLVSSAITAGSPCGCSAAYSPSAYFTLPKHILDFFFIYLFFFCIFFFIYRSASCR